MQPSSTASQGRQSATTSSDPSMKILMGALEESRRELLELRLEFMSVRDSLRIIGMVARQQDQFTRTLVDKVASLEQRLLMAEAGRSAQSTPLRSAPLTQARPQPAPLTRPGPSNAQRAARPGTSLAADYTEGVNLFNRKRYDDAKTWFARLLTMGITEDLADNCEYWVGECDFARGRWTMAVESFERVVALRNSNKRADAMLMLGRSFEYLRQAARARATFEQLVREYPSSSAASTARWKLRSMQQPADAQTDGSVLS